MLVEELDPCSQRQSSSRKSLKVLFKQKKKIDTAAQTYRYKENPGHKEENKGEQGGPNCVTEANIAPLTMWRTQIVYAEGKGE